jgi:hypothetical protein
VQKSFFWLNVVVSVISESRQISRHSLRRLYQLSEQSFVIIKFYSLTQSHSKICNFQTSLAGMTLSKTLKAQTCNSSLPDCSGIALLNPPTQWNICRPTAVRTYPQN